MKLTTTFEDRVCVIAVEGSLDALTSRELEQAVEDNAPKCEKMILDMTRLDYISSAGLRAVVGANRILGKDNLTLRGLCENVTEIFRISGFTKVLNIE